MLLKTGAFVLVSDNRHSFFEEIFPHILFYFSYKLLPILHFRQPEKRHDIVILLVTIFCFK